MVVDGWTAWSAVAGDHEQGRWADIIATGRRFHAALAGVPRPDFIARRSASVRAARRCVGLSALAHTDRGPIIRRTMNAAAQHLTRAFWWAD